MYCTVLYAHMRVLPADSIITTLYTHCICAGGRVLVPPQTSRFPVVPPGGPPTKPEGIGCKNHNIMAFQVREM
jgi:hypothetical protein